MKAKTSQALVTAWAAAAEDSKKRKSVCLVCDLPAEFRKAVEQAHEMGIARAAVQNCLKREGHIVSVYFLRVHQTHAPAKKARK